MFLMMMIKRMCKFNEMTCTACDGTIQRKLNQINGIKAVGTCTSFLYGVVVVFILVYGFSKDNMELVHQCGHEL